jgi:WD40 repeat protein
MSDTSALPSEPTSTVPALPSLLSQLLREWVQRRARGAEVSVDELTKEHPEMREQLRALIEGLSDIPPPPLSSLPEVPGYTELSLLGIGGMGVVYRARQTGLERLVALKMIRSDFADAAERTRFRREAEAVARLDHPNIVKIFQVGESNGQPFFAMEYVEGGNLAQHLERTSMPGNPAASLVTTLARGMEHAHQRGVIHRDLKPANVLLATACRFALAESDEANAKRQAGARDGIVPKITDFGLAKKLDESGQTQTGAIMGTPSYMAPEQAEGKKDIGLAADVYALGAILYECLVGRPPFKAATTFDTLYQVIHEEPVPPRQLNAKVPADLETIALKCLQKEPGKRYGSAGELADDVDRFLKGEPIQARPVSRLERAGKWVRRHPAVSGLLTAVVLVTVLGFAGTYSKYRDAEQQTNIAVYHRRVAEAKSEVAREKTREAETALVKARQAEQESAARARAEARANAQAQFLLYVNKLALAQREADNRNPVRAMQVLESCSQELRGWEHGHLRRRCQVETLPLFKGHAGAVNCVRFSPDGTRLASGGSDGMVRIWNAGNGREVLCFKAHLKGVTSISFSPRGRRLASGGGDGTVRIWDAGIGQEVLSIKAHSNEARSVCFSPDGARLASVGDGRVRLWDARSGRLLRLFRGGLNPDNSVCFSPDGTRLASGGYGWNRLVRLWDVRSGQVLHTLKGHTNDISCVCFSPDGTRLASSGWGTDRTVRVWDASSGRELLTLEGHTNLVFGVCFSPDGTRLASAAFDSTVRVWDGRNGRTLLTIETPVRNVCFSPDGTRLAGAGWDGTVRVWDLRGYRDFLLLKGHTNDIFSACFSPDGQRLASASADRTVRLWDVRTGQELHTLKGHTDHVLSVCFSPDGRQLASGSADRTVRLWDARGGLLRTLKGHTEWVRSVCFSPDGKRLASAGLDGTVRLWDVSNGQELRTLEGQAKQILSVSFSPDGRRLASAGGTIVRLWDASSGRELRNFKGHTRAVSNVCFSPDGNRLASAGEDHTVRLWDIRSGQLLSTLKGHTNLVLSVCFSPDGRLASAGWDHTIRLWDPDRGSELLTLRGHANTVRSVCFSRDGRLASASSDGTIGVWNSIGVRHRDNKTPQALARQQAIEREDDFWTTVAWHYRKAGDAEDGQRWFACAFHLNRVLTLAPHAFDQQRLRVRRTAMLKQAVAGDSRDDRALAALARVCLEAGDLAGYRRACAALLRLAQDSKDDRLFQEVGRLCALGPDAVTDLKPVLQAAEKSVADFRGPVELRTLGSLLLRAGRTEEAALRLQEARAAAEMIKGQPAETPCEDLLLALTYRKLGREDDARRSLARAVAWLQRERWSLRAGAAVLAGFGGPLAAVQALQQPLPPDSRERMIDWETWLELQFLRREAEK